MTSIIVRDAWSPTDAATVNSHWVAIVTVARLGARHVEATTREQAVDAIDSTPGAGVAFFGHGDEGALLAADPSRPRLVDADNVHVLAGRWVQ